MLFRSYGMGNLKNVQKACHAIGLEATITADPEVIFKAPKIILPGVGAFRDAIAELNRTGLGEAVKEGVAQGAPILGICLGMQLLFDKSYEYGEHEGLGILPGEIVRFKEGLTDEHTGELLKVPHMGWNTLEVAKEAPLFKGLEPNSSVYFVHSYYLETTEDVVSGYTHYGNRIAVAAQKDTVYATQFHPEIGRASGRERVYGLG